MFIRFCVTCDISSEAKILNYFGFHCVKCIFLSINTSETRKREANLITRFVSPTYSYK